MNQVRHFELELAELRRSLVGMGDLVVRELTLAVDGIVRPTPEVREQAGRLEEEADRLETAIEDRCHAIMALQSPMARDLRLLISALRITEKLEQIGDCGESLAKRASYIALHQQVTNPPQLEDLGRLVVEMVRHAMATFVSGDGPTARSVVEDERRSDRLTKECYGFIQGAMTADPQRIKEYTHLLRAVGLLEQIGDLALSITEESMYLYRGQNVRHNHESI